MAVYHHLIFDAGNHVESVQSVEAENDAEAKAYATKLLPSAGRIFAVEVWKGRRRVHRVQNPPDTDDKRDG